MIKITVISLGKLKEKYFISAADEYLKRLSRYAKTETVEIEPERLPENPSAAQIETALLKEGENIKKRIPKDCFCCALCVEGKELSSEELAKTVDTCVCSGKNLCFIIGSSYGLHKTVKEASDLRLSLSKMTFPHKLFRVMLFEQIYRAFKISEGGNYHK